MDKCRCRDKIWPFCWHSDMRYLCTRTFRPTSLSQKTPYFFHQIVVKISVSMGFLEHYVGNREALSI